MGQSQMVDVPGSAGAMPAFLARPDGSGAAPAVVVIQEAFGLNGHIKDVAGRLAADELPVDSAPAPVPRQQRRVEADARVPRQSQQGLGHDLRDVREHAEIRARVLERASGLRRLERPELVDGDAGGERRGLEWIRLPAGVGRADDRRDDVARRHQPRHHLLGKRRLPDEEDAHVRP